MAKKHIIFSILLIVATHQIAAQVYLPALPKLNNYTLNTAITASKHTATKDLLKPKNIYTIPANYYTSTFGFVCKKELQLQKLTKIPLYFRLGSMEYCNKLEGKK